MKYSIVSLFFVSLLLINGCTKTEYVYLTDTENESSSDESIIGIWERVNFHKTQITTVLFFREDNSFRYESSIFNYGTGSYTVNADSLTIISTRNYAGTYQFSINGEILILKDADGDYMDFIRIESL